MERIEPMFVDVARAFDSIAPEFDTSFENDVTQRIRTIVYSTISSLAPPHSPLLDINCGTGIDATALSSLGYTVTGIDISSSMLEQARTRTPRTSRPAPEFHQCNFQDLSILSGRTFEVVLSNFGGLNCSDSVEQICREVAGVTVSGGHFVAVVMPRACIWELAAGFAKFNVGEGVRRFRKEVYATGFGSHSFRVYYHPLRKFVKAASKWFDPVSARGLCVVSPPPHASGFRSSFSKLSGVLRRVDNILGRLPVLRGMGDHYLVVLRRNTNRL